MAIVVAAAVLFPQSRSDARQAEVRVRAARLIDGTGKTFENVTVAVSGARINALNASHSGRVDVDLGQATLLPGLIDVHVHIGWHFGADGKFEPRAATPTRDVLYAAENAYLTLMAGFTTIQSVGQPVDVELRDAIARGVLPGPRLLTSIVQIGPSDATANELRHTVRELKRQGADVVKIIDSVAAGGTQRTLTGQQWAALCGEAKAAGMRTLVHAQTTESVRAAVDAGCTQIEHGTGVDESALQLMAKRGVYFDPHVGLVMQNYLKHKDRFLGVAGYTEAEFDAMPHVMRLNAALIRKAVETPGLKLVMGSDAVAGAHGRNADEIVERVRQGRQKPMDAIISATSLAAESLGLGTTIGRLAPGYLADMIAVNGNPASDISALTRVVFVMKDGKVYKR